MATAFEVQKFKADSALLVGHAKADLERFWSAIDLSNPAAARDALLQFTPVLTAEYGELAAALAADWYDDLRALAGITDTFTAQLAGTVATDVVEARTRFGAQHLWTPVPDQTLSFLAGATAEYVLQPGRDTIAHNAARDPRASGWHRQTRPGSCDFCRLLAGRGGVYKKVTAKFAAHGDCNCVAVPSWDASAQEVDVEQYVASERTSKMSDSQRSAHTARVRAFLADMAS